MILVTVVRALSLQFVLDWLEREQTLILNLGQADLCGKISGQSLERAGDRARVPSWRYHDHDQVTRLLRGHKPRPSAFLRLKAMWTARFTTRGFHTENLLVRLICSNARALSRYPNGSATDKFTFLHVSTDESNGVAGVRPEPRLQRN